MPGWYGFYLSSGCLEIELQLIRVKFNSFTSKPLCNIRYTYVIKTENSIKKKKERKKNQFSLSVSFLLLIFASDVPLFS